MKTRHRKDSVRYSTSLIAAVFAVMLLSLSGCTAKYAVLVSTDTVTSDDVAYHSEWWYDLYLQYAMLREKGFKDQNIYVLYANGTDFSTSHSDYDASANFGFSITDMAMSKANVNAVFNSLASQVDGNDHLYVWWMGHGSGGSTCNTTMHIGTSSETMTDTELTAAINQVTNYGERVVTMMTCFSGGLVDNLDVSGTRTVVLTSSRCNQLSYDASATCNGIFHADFNYTLPNGLREQDPCGGAVSSDSDGDGSVSISESHAYNVAGMTTSDPQMGDTDGLAPTIRIDKSNP